ncbi:MAG: hypothetical protein GY822_16095 [Deltaproteobacteria bacterium]|nr:hypothetical protein [Deltaproteobacteria bacterium]
MRHRRPLQNTQRKPLFTKAASFFCVFLGVSPRHNCPTSTVEIYVVTA